MIETIYPAKDTDTVFTGRSRKLPRNIRTCGKSGSPYPVYIEDYVETYLHHLAEAEFPECCVSVLVGQVMDTEEGRSLFVRGAIFIRQIWQEGQCVFGEGIWNEVYEKIRLYFPEDEVAGWCIAGPGFRIQDEEPILRVHLDNFADSERILMTYESLEKEESIRICKDGRFFVLPGYSIYYEKNDEMQNYMLDHKLRVSKSIVKQEAVQAKPEKDTDILTNIKNDAGGNEKAQGKKERRDSYRDVLQLGAIAGVIILIIAVLIGVDLLSGKWQSESTGGQSAQVSESGGDSGDTSPDAPAFGDFSFLKGSGTGQMNEAAQSGNGAGQSTDRTQDGTGTGQSTDGAQSGNGNGQSIDGTQSGVGEATGSGQTSENTQSEDETQGSGNGQSADGAQSGVGEVTGSGQTAENTQSGDKVQESGAGQKSEGTQGSGVGNIVESAQNESEKPDEQAAQIPSPTEAEEELSNKIEEPVQEVLARNEYSLYYVKSGDTLASICKQHYGTVELMTYISEVNQIVDINRIYVGQELILPNK